MGSVFTKEHISNQYLLFDNVAYQKWDETKKQYINFYSDGNEEKDKYVR